MEFFKHMKLGEEFGKGKGRRIRRGVVGVEMFKTHYILSGNCETIK